MTFFESLILSLVPGILSSILAALEAGGKLSPNVLAILQSIDAGLDMVPGVDTNPVVQAPPTPTAPAA